MKNNAEIKATQKMLVLSSTTREKIWGSDYFRNTFSLSEGKAKIGEMWICSGYENEESIIINGPLKGMTLNSCFKKHKALFNSSKLEDFPILIKLIATSDKLSVQVHPDDIIAKEKGFTSGKTEGWLVLKCDEDASIVLSHNAKNKEELRQYIKNNDYEHLLNVIKVKKGYFYPVPSKTIHAIGKGIVLLEIQQSADITYRFYDYDRVDVNNLKRPLQVENAIDCTSFESYNEIIHNVLKDDSSIVWDNKYFIVYNQKVVDCYTLNNKSGDYYIITVIDGSIKINGRKINYGECVIITSCYKKCTIKGNGRIIITKSKI